MAATSPERQIGLRLWVTKAVEAYERVQVELHGKYSVERVVKLHAYQQTYATWQCILVMIVTPLPCLAIIVATDLVPLKPPSDGYAHNAVFFVRIFFVGFAIAVALLEQARHFVADLPMSTPTLFGISVFISALATLYGYLMASVIGFPLPFTIIFCAPCFSSSLAVVIMLLWGPLLRTNAVTRHEMVSYAKIMVVQFSLTVVYPAYNVVFIQLSGNEQTVVAVLLPLIKLAAKNAISMVFSERLEDFRPEVIIFNVEVFHALFVSCCMQNSRSWSTTIAIMVLDFIHTCSSLHDVDVQLRKIENMEVKLRVASPTPHNNPGKALSLIAKAMYYVHVDEAVQHNASIRLRSVEMMAPRSVAVHPVAGTMHTDTAARKASLIPGLTMKSAFQASQSKYEVSIRTNWISNVPVDKRSSLGVLTTRERVEYVASILQVLHIAEFLLLVEFVEVIIPVVYSVYLTAMFYLPNRVYYPQLVTMDTHSLLSTIGNTLGYAALEFVSFIGLCIALRQKLELSPVHQLAFVVHTQWNLVQSKLILWVVFAVHTSLAHFGYDYSFRFAWLRRK